MAEFVIDTHALVWFLEDNPRLGKIAAAAMEDPGNALNLPAIVLAEIVWLAEHGKTAITDIPRLFSKLDADPRFRIVPLSDTIVRLTVGLKAIGEMHDRQIVATTIALGADAVVTLLTKDANITASAVVPTAW